MSKLRDLIENIVPCQDCGGYVSDHQGVQGECNYEAGTEIVDNTIKSLLEMAHFPDIAEKTDNAFGLRCEENHLINRDNFLCKTCTNIKASEARKRITQTFHDDIATELEKKQQELNDRLKLLTNDNKQFQVTASYLLDLAQRAELLFTAFGYEVKAGIIQGEK